MKFLRYGMMMLLAPAMLGGCASPEHSFEEEGAYDPIEPINRAVYGFNKKIAYFTLNPAAYLYGKLPSLSQDVIANVLENLQEPQNIVNHMLQTRGDDAARSTARLLFNSVLGVGGMVDVAGKMGIEGTKNDFGKTVRTYIGNRGAYVVLPLLGPSSVVDMPGFVVDGALSPTNYARRPVRYVVGGLSAVRAYSRVLDNKQFLELALDEYSLVRDAWEGRRRNHTSDAEL